MYHERINKTIIYIENNLSNKITLDELADEAMLSKYYYHRLFHVLTGEPVMEYIRKRRLGRAVKQMNETTLGLLEIAVDNQFESQEVFTRAFTKHFGITPAKYRKIEEKVKLTDEIAVVGIESGKRGNGVQPKIVVREAVKLVGMTIQTTVEENLKNFTIAKFYNEIFNKRMSEINGKRFENIKYGTSISDETGENIFHTACVEVGNKYSVPEGMEVIEMPYSRYMRFFHKGPPEKIPETYYYIYKEWLPYCGYELSKTGKDLQVYDCKKFDMFSEEFEMEIFVPIE